MSSGLDTPAGERPTTFEQGSQYKVDNIYDVSPSFLGDLGMWFTQNPFSINLAQMPGYNQLTPYVADRIAPEENGTMASGTWADLATVGPKLDSLPDGKYLVMWGCTAWTSDVTGQVKMSISVNGGTPTEADKAYVRTATGSGCASATVYTLNAGGANTLKAQYSKGGQTSGTWGGRWLVAIRVSGP